MNIIKYLSNGYFLKHVLIHNIECVSDAYSQKHITCVSNAYLQKHYLMHIIKYASNEYFPKHVLMHVYHSRKGGDRFIIANSETAAVLESLEGLFSELIW